jgi:TPR repeat protein
MKKTTLFSAFLICLSLTLGCNGTASDAQPVSPNENVSVKETKQSVVVSQNETESVPVANEVTPVSVNNAISEDLSKYLDRACAKNISKELENPIALFSKAAEGGDMKAQYLLAECYFHGEGADENFEKAVFWYQKSAAQDYFYAQEMLAACYAAGKGIQKKVV